MLLFPTVFLLAAPSTLQSPVDAFAGGAGRAIDACDDFDRAAGTNMGPDWNEVQGDFGILNNAGYGVAAGDQYMIHTSALAGVFGSDMAVDFLPDVQGRNGMSVALISGYADSLSNVFIKVEDGDSDGLYDKVVFLNGISGTPWNAGANTFSLATPTSSGRMSVFFTSGGDVANCDITNGTSGALEHFESSGLLSSGVIFGLQFGIGVRNSAAFDNYELNDGCTATPSLSVSGLAAGGTATLTLDNATPFGQVGFAYSINGPGPSNVPAGPCGMISVDLTAPFVTLPLQIADAAGTASISGPVPPGTGGITVYFHALDVTSCALSNSFGLTIL